MIHICISTAAFLGTGPGCTHHLHPPVPGAGICFDQPFLFQPFYNPDHCRLRYMEPVFKPFQTPLLSFRCVRFNQYEALPHGQIRPAYKIVCIFFKCIINLPDPDTAGIMGHFLTPCSNNSILLMKCQYHAIIIFKIVLLFSCRKI